MGRAHENGGCCEGSRSGEHQGGDKVKLLSEDTGREVQGREELRKFVPMGVCFCVCGNL